MATTFASIWKDTFVNLTSRLSGGKVTFTVKHGSTVIYTGTAFADPSGNCFVKVNDICAPYLVPTPMAVWTRDEVGDNDIIDDTLTEVFTVYVGTTLTDTVTYLWDYSYETPLPGSTGPYTYLDNPISRKYVTGMPWTSTIVENETLFTYTKVSYDHISSYRPRYNPILVPCGNAALYYRNSRGGMDFLLLEGIKAKETYTRSSIDTPINNTYATARGKRDFFNQVVKSWTCYTGRVEFPERINELLGSNHVELWTLANGDTFVPVNIKATSADILSYKTNGRKPVEFTFDIELAQDRIRR